MLLASCSSQVHPPDWREQLAAWKHPDPLPAFELTDQEGKRFVLSRYEGSYTLVSFVFTSCQVKTACPMTTSKMAAAQSIDGLQLLSLTIDPEIDSPSVLRKYGVAAGADFSRWTFATGDAELMTEGLPSLFNVMRIPDSEVRLNHTVRSALVGPDLRVIQRWQDNAWTLDELRAAMAR